MLEQHMKFKAGEAGKKGVPSPNSDAGENRDHLGKIFNPHAHEFFPTSGNYGANMGKLPPKGKYFFAATFVNSPEFVPY